MEALTLRDHPGTRALDAEAAGRDAPRLARAAAEGTRRRYALPPADVVDLVGHLMLLPWAHDRAALRRANRYADGSAAGRRELRHVDTLAPARRAS